MEFGAISYCVAKHGAYRRAVCFLAELIEVGAEHGIIVDDPVT